MNLEDDLSKRSKRMRVDPHYTNTYSSYPALFGNPYCPNENPNGIINFGTAVSALMDDVWKERFTSQGPSLFPAVLESKYFRYYQYHGTDEFRSRIAAFMTNFFKPSVTYGPIKASDVFVLNGALLSMDILAFLLADEGDCFLVPTPAYNGYFSAGVQRWGVRMVGVPLMTEGGMTCDGGGGNSGCYTLSEESLEKAYSSVETGRIRAFLLNNPHNPLGIVLQPELVRSIMAFCQRKGIHLIADEMYCMSVFEPNAQFKSVLELTEPGLLDENRLHVIWGFSKDLCLTSFRTGVVLTKNKSLQGALNSGSQFQAVPLPIMDILSSLIKDISWFERVFVPTNHSRLKEACATASQFFLSKGIPISTTSAGFFFMVDFNSILGNPPNESRAKELIRVMYANGVYLTPSWEMQAHSPGHFRFVFSPCNSKGLATGLLRLEKALEEFASNSKPTPS